MSRPQNSTKVVLATSPKLVRTSMGNMFVTPMSSQASSPQTRVQSPSPPARKRLKLSETTEKAVAFDTSDYRRRIIEHKIRRMRIVREKYVENASELFFLHVGGNMMDYHSWQKRPPTPQYLHFLRQHPLDPDDDDEDLTAPFSSDFSQLSTVTTVATATVATAITTTTTAAVTATVATVTAGSTMVQIPNQSTEVKISGAGVTPIALSTTLPAAALAQLTQQGKYRLIIKAARKSNCSPLLQAILTRRFLRFILHPSRVTLRSRIELDDIILFELLFASDAYLRRIFH